MECPNCKSKDIVEIINYESLAGNIIKLHPLYFKKDFELCGCYNCGNVWLMNLEKED